MAMKHPGGNINFNAASYWLSHNHVIFDRPADQHVNRRIEPQRLQQHKPQAWPVAEVVEGCHALGLTDPSKQGWREV